MAGILKVDKYQDFNGNDIMTRDGAGNITINNAALKNTPAFRVTNSSVQSIPHNAWTKVTFDTEDYDTDNAFASSTFTVPSGKGGRYIFNWSVVAEVDSGENVASRLYVNSVANNKTYTRSMSSGIGEAILNNVSVHISLSAGDTVELYMYQNQGAAQNNDTSYTYFSGYKLIGA